MSVKFSVKENLYAICGFEIINATQEEVEEALDEIGENCSADDLAMRLVDVFGWDNVKCDGVDGDSIESSEEHEFWDWGA